MGLGSVSTGSVRLELKIQQFVGFPKLPEKLIQFKLSQTVFELILNVLPKDFQAITYDFLELIVAKNI